MNNKGFNDSSSGERIGFSVDCCVDCGGSLLGNGLTMPIHCENIESPDCACPDEGPFYCGVRGGFHHDMDVMALGLGYCGGGRIPIGEPESLAEPRKDSYPVIVIGVGGERIGKGVLSLGVAVCNAGKSAQQMGRLLRISCDIKSITGGFNLSVGRTPFEYYYQTKFGIFSKDKHPRGNKFKKAVHQFTFGGKWMNSKWVTNHE